MKLFMFFKSLLEFIGLMQKVLEISADVRITLFKAIVLNYTDFIWLGLHPKINNYRLLPIIDKYTLNSLQLGFGIVGYARFLLGAIR